MGLSKCSKNWDSLYRILEDRGRLRSSCKMIESIRPDLQHAIFGRMYWHHVKTGRKQRDDPEYGRLAFLGTDPHIAVTPEERKEVLRQIEIKTILGNMGRAPLEGMLSYSQELERVDTSVADQLFQSLRGLLGGKRRLQRHLRV